MQFMHTLFVYDEELRWGIQGYSLCLLDNQVKCCNCSHWDVKVRTHILRKIFSRNFSSIQSGLISFQLRQIVNVRTIVA